MSGAEASPVPRPGILGRIAGLLTGRAATLLIAVLALTLGIATFFAFASNLLSPDQIVGLVLANLISLLLLAAVLAGNLTRMWVQRRRGAAGARLHVRLVLLFSGVALTPTIVVAVLSLVDFSILKSTWRFSKLDFIAVATTLLATLMVGVESGLVMGVVVSLALFLFRASRPHIATVGLVPGTEHFRNVLRHEVLVSPKLVCLRVDASMFFANARGVEDRINAEVAARPELEHVLLQCSAVNDIDASALESLEAIASRLKDSGIALHFSEIKGPVMDKLNTTHFLDHLHGKVFLTNYQAIQALTPEVIH